MVCIVRTMAFPVVMHGCENWTIKKAECQRNDPLKVWCWIKLTFQSPMDSKEIKPVSPKGNQPWIFTGRADAEPEIPILWPRDVKRWLIRKDPDTGKHWRQEEKGTTEDEMVGWHHRLNGHGFGWTPGVGEGQGGLVCCNSWGRKELDMNEWLNWTKLSKGEIKNKQLKSGT